MHNDNKQNILKKVKQDGRALKYVHDGFMTDKEVGLPAEVQFFSLAIDE